MPELSKSRKKPNQLKLAYLKTLNLSHNSMIDDNLLNQTFGLITDSLETLYLVNTSLSDKTVLKILEHLPKTLYELDLS
jgi:hypothetical protein